MLGIRGKKALETILGDDFYPGGSHIHQPRVSIALLWVV